MLDEIDDLASKLLDASLDAPERTRLNQLLRSTECRERFVELSKIHYCLVQRTASVTTLRTARAASAVHDSILQIATSSVGASAADDCECECAPLPGVCSETRFGATKRLRVGERPRARRLVAVCTAVAAAGLLVIFSWPERSDQGERPEGLAVRLGSQGSGGHDSGGHNPGGHGSGGRASTGHGSTGRASTGHGSSEVAQRADPVESSTIEAKVIEAKVFAARIISMSEQTAWEPDAAPGDFLMRLSVGEDLKLTRGLAKLEFASKASVVLSGPAELKILGPGEVLLRHGKLTGRSEEGDFVVQTPSAYVVDVGTAFGVAVDDRAVTDVVVFDGEVHVQRSESSSDKVKLTPGMTARADGTGLNASRDLGSAPAFDREFNGERPTNLGPNELSLVDIICGSAPGEYRFAGSIDPELGAWSTLPWSESKGVRGKAGNGKVVPVDWNPWVHGVFIPAPQTEHLTLDLDGQSVLSPPLVGGAWGPIWARRRIERHLDPLAAQADRDVEGFWGAGTTTALLDRSRWVRDGVMGMHANVGVTLDLQRIRQGYGVSLKSLRGVLAHLEQSYVSQPFQPQALATFQIFVDGELRYERNSFCRQDGDAMFGIDLTDGDRLLSLVVTDGNDGPVYDRVILLDPLIEIGQNSP